MASSSTTDRRRPKGLRLRRGAAPVAEISLAVSRELAAGDTATAWRWLVQFADDYRGSSAAGKRWLVAETPPLVGQCCYDAAIAGLVEHLCAEAGLPAPAWTGESERFSEPWWFPAGLPALEATMVRDSPISFKRHGVFVGANAFYRA